MPQLRSAGHLDASETLTVDPDTDNPGRAMLRDDYAETGNATVASHVARQGAL